MVEGTATQVLVAQLLAQMRTKQLQAFPRERFDRSLGSSCWGTVTMDGVAVQWCSGAVVSALPCEVDSRPRLTSVSGLSAPPSPSRTNWCGEVWSYNPHDATRLDGG